MRRYIVYISILMFCSNLLNAQTISDIISDIYEQVEEYGGNLEDLSQELMELHNQRIDLNTATEEDLQRLRFLSDLQIDNILTYVYKHPMQSVYELQLVPGLRDYEIRNLSYFVITEKPTIQEQIYPREIFHYAKHELTLRTDARNIENAKEDPFYGNLRYRFNYKNRVMAGFSLQRGASVPWKELNYGGYIQLNNMIPHIKTLVIGNFQGQFGQGLILGQAVHMGKSTYIMSSANGAEGVKKYSSASDSYDYLHGIASTLKFGSLDITALYSIRKEKDSLWHHVVGFNTTYKHNKWKIGLTAIENIYRTDSTATAFGVNARYNMGRWDLWGEVATSYASQWGWGTIVGARLSPINGLGFLLFYRYYSPTYYSRYAQTFAETSKVNDENGLYIGTEIKLVPQWRFSIYADGFYFSGPKYGIPKASWGWDMMGQADFEVNQEMSMFWKFRAKRRYVTDTYSLRYQFNWNQGGWHLRTQLDGSLVKKGTNNPTCGFSVLQDVHYSFRQVPITLQLRVQAFDVKQWDNRIYIYENDVLYAMSIPATYHVGGRLYLNMRYQICKNLSAYCRVSETFYHPQWTGDNKPTRTDVHLLLRATF